AEDGIRDRNVTGVQTCALPIYWSTIAMENAEKNLHPDSPYQPLVQTVRAALSGNFGSSATSADLAQVFYKAATDNKAKSRYYNRSEERRVGKERVSRRKQRK